MKKIISFLLCIIICLSVCACSSKKIEPDASSSGVSHKEQSSSENVTSSEQASDNTSSEKKTETSSTKDTSSKKWDITSKKETNTTSKKPSNTSSKNNSSKNNSSKNQNSSPEVEFPIFEGTGLVPGKDFGYFTYSGNHSGMAIIGDVIYSIYQGDNTLVVYDSKKLKILANVALPAYPYEIQAKGNQIFISFPRLKYIGVYSTLTYEQVSKISVGNRIGSFCVTGTNIYYAEEGGNYIYKTCANSIGFGDKLINQSFTNPKIAVDTDKGILYIGESGSAGSALYYYELGQKKIVSTYKRDGKGINNPYKSLFIVGNYVYWGGMKFDAKKADVPLAEFSAGGNTYFADNKYIFVNNIMYDINTCQPLAEFVDFNYIAVTESENLVIDIRDATYPYKVIIIPG